MVFDDLTRETSDRRLEAQLAFSVSVDFRGLSLSWPNWSVGAFLVVSLEAP